MSVPVPFGMLRTLSVLVPWLTFLAAGGLRGAGSVLQLLSRVTALAGAGASCFSGSVLLAWSRTATPPSSALAALPPREANSGESCE